MWIDINADSHLDPERSHGVLHKVIAKKSGVYSNSLEDSEWPAKDSDTSHYCALLERTHFLPSGY